MNPYEWKPLEFGYMAGGKLPGLRWMWKWEHAMARPGFEVAIYATTRPANLFPHNEGQTWINRWYEASRDNIAPHVAKQEELVRWIVGPRDGNGCLEEWQ